MKVFINSIAELQALNAFLMTARKPVDARQMHYVVNAKSLMGCFSLDWSQGVNVITYCNEDEANLLAYLKKCKIKVEE